MKPNILDFMASGQAIIDMPNYDNISFLENFGFSPIECVEQEALHADTLERAAFLKRYIIAFKDTFSTPPKSYIVEQEDEEEADFEAIDKCSVCFRNIRLLHTSAWYMMGNMSAEIRAVKKHLEELESHQIVVDNLNEITRIIMNSKDSKEACANLQKHFEIGYIKAQYLLSMPLSKINTINIVQTAMEKEDYLLRLAFLLKLSKPINMFDTMILLPKGFESLTEYFVNRVYSGAEVRYGSYDNTLHDRIKFEVKQICDLGLESYFLFISDLICETFQKMNIYHSPGRSSTAGSVVAYCLGITDINPLEYGLLFERFINPIGLFNIQIDIDFEYCELQQIVDYLRQKYGDDQVAQMIDMERIAQKSAIIKVGKGLTFDIIGILILTIMKECIKNIEHKYGSDTMNSIINPPKDDEQTFRLFQEGNTKGVFLFESDSMRKNLKKLQPSTFEELVALYAICRPEQMDLMNKYIKRKHNLEPITYYYPIMEKHLKETAGVAIYQEQIMLLCQEIANFTPAESDILARGVCCRRMNLAEDILKEKFIKGGVENGFDKETLETIWSDWMKYACYLSNKSHAVCYTLLAYKMAYLKAHYPKEFMKACGSINEM